MESIVAKAAARHSEGMKHAARLLSVSFALLWTLAIPSLLRAEPSAAAIRMFSAYAAGVEQRLAEQHRSDAAFLAQPDGDPAQTADRLRRGAVILVHIPSPSNSVTGALLHHWRATAFAPGATAAAFERLIRNFKAYPQHFAPDVMQAAAVTSGPNTTLMRMRVRQRHVITVVLDGTYDVSFGELDRRHGYSISRSVHIDEIADAGTPREHVLSPADEHGFLWRQNTYWSFEERDGGLYLQVESISLTRDIPHGLGWAVRPYIESIPRESLEFTLRSACNAIRK